MCSKKVSLVFISIFVVLLLIVPLISAFEFDNKKTYTLDDTTSKYGKIEVYNSFFLGLGIGDKLWDAELKKNTDVCGEFCSAEKEITIYKDGALIDDIKFETIKQDGSRVEQDIRSYKFYILQDGIKIPYEIGQTLKKGTYQVILEGEKKPSRTVDWQIKSNGKWSEEWALWGVENEFYVIIKADTLSVAGLEINGVNVTSLGNNMWKLNVTDNFNISKAKVMKTLFYGTDGTTPRVVSPYIENISFIISSDWNDLGKRAIYANHSFNSPVEGTVIVNWTGTFNQATSNEDVNFWSYLYVNVALGPDTGTMSVDGVTLNTVTGGFSDEFGTDTYGENKDNPTKVKLQIYANAQTTDGGSGNEKAVILTRGSMTWTLEGSTVQSPLYDYRDFYLEDSIPLFSRNIKLNSPIDNYVSLTNAVEFNCSAYVLDGVSIVNMSLWTNQSETYQIENFTTGLSSKFESIVFNHTIIDDGNYLWGCQVCDSDDDCSLAGENRTITIDTLKPELTINLPTSQEDYGSIWEIIPLNWTVNDVSGFGTCIYNYNGTDVEVNCTEGNATFILEKDNYNITFFVNDTAGNSNTTYHNWTYKIFENSRNFSNLTYETSTQSYKVNVTSNSTLTSTSLIYGGTSYASTLSGDTYSTTITHTVNGTNQIYWNFTYGGDIFSSYYSNQTVNNTEFNICNVSSSYLNTTFLNISFKDEETLLRIGGQIDTSTIDYWLGDGSVIETLVYSNLTNMSEHNFCFTPASETMKNDRTFQYSATGYPQRKYDDDSSLTNSTIHKTLYLLSSVDGIYSTIQVIDENSDLVSGADVTMERQFAGVWTIVGKETSDGAGAVTFWVNPDYDHKFTIEKSGCITASATIRPTQTTYTATMDCLGVSDEIYIAPIEGIKYFLLPSSGLITAGEQNFSFQVASSKNNIVGAKFEIVNLSNYILTSQTSVCAAAGCTISKLYDVDSPDNIKGRYYVNTGQGYILLEADAHWITVNITARDGTFEQFWLNLRGVFDEWHEEGEDTTNTSDFNRIVFIFLFMAIFISVFNKLTGFDTANPGAFLIFLTVVTFIGSVAGHPDSGFFSLDNTGWGGFLDNYFVFGIVFMNTIVHWMIVKLGAQR